MDSLKVSNSWKWAWIQPVLVDFSLPATNPCLFPRLVDFYTTWKDFWLYNLSLGVLLKFDVSNYWVTLEAISSRPARNLGSLSTQPWIYTVRESFRLYKSHLKQLLFFWGWQISLENDRKGALFQAFQRTFSFLEMEFQLKAPKFQLINIELAPCS